MMLIQYKETKIPEVEIQELSPLCCNYPGTWNRWKDFGNSFYSGSFQPQVPSIPIFVGSFLSYLGLILYLNMYIPKRIITKIGKKEPMILGWFPGTRRHLFNLQEPACDHRLFTVECWHIINLQAPTLYIKLKKIQERMQGSRNLAVNLHRLIAAKFLDSLIYRIPRLREEQYWRNHRSMLSVSRLQELARH